MKIVENFIKFDLDWLKVWTVFTFIQYRAPSHSASSRSAHQPSPPAFLPGSPSTGEKLSELAALPGPLGLNENLKKTFSIKKIYIY